MPNQELLSPTVTKTRRRRRAGRPRGSTNLTTTTNTRQAMAIPRGNPTAVIHATSDLVSDVLASGQIDWRNKSEVMRFLDKSYAIAFSTR